jgi:hypothetical protein
VVLSGLQDLSAAAGTTPRLVLLEHLASIARWHLLFGRRLICLVETIDPDLELPPLGAEHGAWNRHDWLLAHRTGARLPPWISSTTTDG